MAQTLAGEAADLGIGAAPHLRWWIWGYVALCAAAALVIINVAAMREFAVYLLYMALACTFVPFPTTPMVLFEATRMNFVLVALCGALGTTLANLNEYHLWTSFFRYRLFERIRRSPRCIAATAWFDRAPFFSLFLANVIPLPVDVVRLVAVARQYGRGRFVLANFCGRAIRYGLIAAVGYALDPPRWAIAVLTGLLLAYGLFKFARISGIGRPARENSDVECP